MPAASTPPVVATCDVARRKIAIAYKKFFVSLDVTPVHVSSVPKLLRSGNIHVDVVLIRVRPTGLPGQYTLGVVADYTAALIQSARCVVAEIDDRLPLTGTATPSPSRRVNCHRLLPK